MAHRYPERGTHPVVELTSGVYHRESPRHSTTRWDAAEWSGVAGQV
jgi:hypothetical protein